MVADMELRTWKHIIVQNEQHEPTYLKLRSNSRDTDNIGHMPEQRQTTQTEHRKLKRGATRSQPKHRGWIQMLAKGKQFLLLIWHPPCYSSITLFLFFHCKNFIVGYIYFNRNLGEDCLSCSTCVLSFCLFEQ